MLHNNFSYTQLSPVFVPQEDSYYIHDDDSFLYLLWKDFYITDKHIGTFCLFFLQKDFGNFHMLLFAVFICFFDNIYLPFLYIEKIHKKCFLIFFIAIFSSEFSLSKSEEIFISTIIYYRIFFFFNNIFTFLQKHLG